MLRTGANIEINIINIIATFTRLFMSDRKVQKIKIHLF